MDRATSDIIVVAVAVSIVAAATLIGYWMSLRARREARRERLQANDAAEIQIEALRDELGGEIAQLQERLDYAERLLVQAREARELPLERRPPES
jgi:hypothetical protein